MKIIFKGIDIITNNWVLGSYVERNNKSFIEGSPKYLTEVIPETVCQYIGKKDMRGRKIYTGDIVRYDKGEEYEVY